MNFKPIVLNHIILVYAWVFIKSPLRIHRFINEIQKYVSCDMFLAECHVAIIDSIIMIVPDTKNLGAILLHFSIKWVVFYNLIIFELNMLHWLQTFFLWSQKRCKLVCICCVTAPYEQIRLVFHIAYCFENLWSSITLSIARTPSYPQRFFIFILWNKIRQFNSITRRIDLFQLHNWKKKNLENVKMDEHYKI